MQICLNILTDKICCFKFGSNVNLHVSYGIDKKIIRLNLIAIFLLLFSGMYFVIDLFLQ